MNNDYLNHVPKLSAGAHEAGSGELCVMEAIAYVMGEPHSDMPKCTAPSIARYCQVLNDNMPDEWRQRLWDYAWRIAGTNNLTYEQERAEYLARQAKEVFVPLAKKYASAVDAYTSAAAAASAYDAAAASAAYAAAASAASASYAASADDAAVWQAALDVLDGVLQIGPKPTPVPHPERVLELELER